MSQPYHIQNAWHSRTRLGLVEMLALFIPSVESTYGSGWANFGLVPLAGRAFLISRGLRAGSRT